MEDEIEEVLTGVRVFAVNLVGPDLLVDVYGGEQLLCSTIRYPVDGSWGWQKFLSEVVEWAMEGTPLSYVRLQNGGVRLVPEWPDG